MATYAPAINASYLGQGRERESRITLEPRAHDLSHMGFFQLYNAIGNWVGGVLDTYGIQKGKDEGLYWVSSLTPGISSSFPVIESGNEQLIGVPLSQLNDRTVRFVMTPTRQKEDLLWQLPLRTNVVYPVVQNDFRRVETIWAPENHKIAMASLEMLEPLTTLLMALIKQLNIPY